VCADVAAKVRLLLSKGVNADARSKLGRMPPTIAAADHDYGVSDIDFERLPSTKMARLPSSRMS
jgi:hypothetical protein